ncbi:MAG: hypothetical protein ACQKBT_02780, partial [Puniceicoccales bacterium]
MTTESLNVSETWEPHPEESVEVGDIFKRTIRQQADNVSGMALAPASDEAPDGLRVYLENPTVQDDTERGKFTGERIDTLSYAIQQSGSYTLPELRYQWWNPKKRLLETTTLPAIHFKASATPSQSTSPHLYGVAVILLAAGTALFCF